jgi:hypothetical protein
MENLRNNNPSGGWAREEDDLLRQLVQQDTLPEIIANRLNRTVNEVRRRGDLIGLPLKWFQRIALLNSN